MAFLGGILAINLPKEEDAYAVLLRMFYLHDLRRNFLIGMDGIRLRLYQFDRLLEQTRPELAAHLNRNGVLSEAYASQWFLTLFAYRYPFDFVFAMYDWFFMDGIKAPLQMSLALLLENEVEILKCQSFDQLLHLLQHDLLTKHQDDMHQWFTLASQITIDDWYLLQLQEQFYKTTKQSYELASGEELSAVRMENQQIMLQLHELAQSIQNALIDRESLLRQLIDHKFQLVDMQERNYDLASMAQQLQSQLHSMESKTDARIQSHTAAMEHRTRELEAQLFHVENELVMAKLRYAEAETGRIEKGKITRMRPTDVESEASSLFQEEQANVRGRKMSLRLSQV